jgi:hypothetical protein
MRGKTNKEQALEYFKEAKRRTQEMKQNLAKETDFYDKDKISERLYRMILYTIGRHDWYEDRLHRLLNIGVALIAAFVALATLISAISSYITLLSLIFGWLATASVLLTGIGMIYYFNSQIARDHPYRKIVDIRSWYFMYNFPSGLKDSLSRKFQEKKQEIEETIQAYETFLKRWLEYAPDRDRFIEEDLEQVFILQLLQRYRFQAVKTMSRILYCGIYATILFAAVAILGHVLN